MKIQELLMNICNKDFNLENDLHVKKYLPVEVKKTIAQGIIYECVNDDDGITKINSVQKYLSYIKYMIIMHTNLEYTDDDYDVLCSTECHGTTLLNYIMDCFKQDAKECEMILNFMIDDYEKEISLEYSIAKFLNDLSSMIAGVVDKIKDVDLQSVIPDNVDMDKLGTFLEKYIK